ncbi:MAG: C4-type zinc ribbon domain-containing protein [candidate division Zixibacteria bacterium]|nr:C4-type zinc ribbon domain-containing protein [candidate division Zixibacteria bacterium]MCI0597294.1 C4-type zinc ribbon domain-containing protein [candidate division Zixibacteria bacterium]
MSEGVAQEALSVNPESVGAAGRKGASGLNKDALHLLELQEVDFVLLELEHSKTYLPEMISQKEKEIGVIEADLKAKQESHKAKILEIKRLELDVSKFQSELANLQKRMKDIKTNKEYDALVKEIDVRRAAVSQSEEKTLLLMSETEDLKKEIEAAKEKLETVKEHTAAELEGLHKELEAISVKVRAKMDERKEKASRLDRQTLSIYERVRKGRGGHAVVRVTSSRPACSGCYKSLPPQRIQELKRDDQIITCQNCGRILIWQAED